MWPILGAMVFCFLCEPLWAMAFFGFVGAPPSGRLLVVCEAYRDGGVAPTGALLCILWEPRHRGDCLWSARLIATGASLLQKSRWGGAYKIAAGVRGRHVNKWLTPSCLCWDMEGQDEEIRMSARWIHELVDLT